MNFAPLAKMGLISPEINMVLAAVIGFGFGFILERAGFGSAKKLVYQWFGKDWSVFRVMFTAIVTAMFGILFLDLINVMPLGNYYLNKTYLYPQILGGLVMGGGFVIGGYCPGTSFVALASGKLDAIFYIFGMLLGVVIFAEFFDFLEGYFNSGDMGSVALPELFGINPWVIGLIVLLIAVVGFWGAGKIEKLVNR